MRLAHEASILDSIHVLVLAVGPLGRLHALRPTVLVRGHLVCVDSRPRFHSGLHSVLHHCLLQTRHGRRGKRHHVGSSGDPLTVEVDTAGQLAFVSNGPPVIEASADAHSSESDGAAADLRVARNVLVHHAKLNVVRNTSNLKLDDFVPAGSLASVFKSLSSGGVLAVSDDDIWVHD